MPANARLIRRRLKSVGNTKKITKAMELVSAAKMRRAVALATAARRFSVLGDELLAELSMLGGSASHPFFRVVAKPEKILCVAISSDRGLCGAYNAQLFREMEKAVAPYALVEYVAIGRTAEQYLRRAGRTVVAAFSELTNAPSARGVKPVSVLCQSEFGSGIYDKVILAFTEYRSALRQEPVTKQLLPLTAPVPEKSEAPRGGSVSKDASSGAIFEPDPSTVLEFALPRFLESAVYQAVLEAAASEHSARMMSMRSATDAAAEMMDDLTFTLNQARQSAITSEIAEISAGRAALEG